MGCSKSGENVRVEGIVLNEDGLDSGIKYSHAYGILKAFEIDDKKNSGEKIRLVRVRNPWGYGEWTGAWCDESEEVEEYRDELTLLMKDDDEPFNPTEKET
jgi:calpain, invertebrate